MIDHNVMQLLQCQVSIQMRIFAKTPETITLVPTDSKLEGLKNVSATEVLLCKLDFVIHSVRSILNLTHFCHYIRHI